MGAGKSALLAEASDLLAARGIVHAAIDLDALAIGHFGDRSSNADLTYRNLAAIWRNYEAAGVERVLVAAAMETRDALDRLRSSLGSPDLIVCRVKAPLAAMQRRVRAREPG